MDVNQVRELLERKKGGRTIVQLAREINITPQYVSDVLAGRRPPSQRILNYLGLQRNYVRIPKAKNGNE